MTNIQENLRSLTKSIPESVTLVAVSKTKPNETIINAYNLGVKVFGENKVQELTQKYEDLPKDIKWHFIGHLQTNKVKYIAPFVSLIHAVDSVKLLKEINKQALKYNRIINCLLQVKIAQEENKFGLSFEHTKEILYQIKILDLKGVNIIGLMGMATNTKNELQIAEEFYSLKTFFEKMKSQYPILNTLSMGMSNDYKIAIDNGSNMIRVGSSLFGKRNYT